ncbi:hypothetical protein [Limosilactobacillus portuensis]|uniref:hypothetical protein n=2 Tax=Limosilactobacillus portuensis TaxID=2742601 RepID=UPI002358B7E5|nr:hypothetical protein [Limosilactobacillus portuensis]WCT61495.1 hypothetical protein PRK60_03845 [Limosilactobacillus portuensis]
MIWVHYFYEGQTLIIWGIMLLIAMGCIEALLKYVSKIAFMRSYADEIIVSFWGMMLLIQGLLFSERLATFAGSLSILIGIVLSISRKINKEEWLKWENCVIGLIFLLIGLYFRAIDLILIGILYIIFTFIKKFLLKKQLNDFFVLSGLLLFAGIGMFLIARIQLQSPFLEVSQNTVVLKEKDVRLKVNTNPNSNVELWKNNKKYKKLETDQYGVTSASFYAPGNYELKVRKNNLVKVIKIRVKASNRYLKYKAHEKLLENNKNGIKEKIEVTSEKLMWNKSQDDSGYFVNIKGATSPGALVTISDEYDEEKTYADKKGYFNIKWRSYNNDEQEIEAYVINSERTKENRERLKIEVNKELKKQEEQNHSKYENNLNDSLVDQENNDDKNSSALKVATENYVIERHPEAEVDPFNYEIKKVSSGMYKIYGSYDENGIKHHYIALAMDDGISKVKILQLADQGE